MNSRRLEWKCRGARISVGLDEAGKGPSLLLLPALSSISTRAEMGPLLEELAGEFQVSAVDWPGFGDGPRPKIDWSPDILSAYLNWLLSEVVANPFAIVAAGHAATYVLHHLARHPGATQRLALVAPTWRGPFPTMMGGTRPWFASLRAAFDAPALGAALYALNLSGPVVRKMGAGHVYEDLAWLSPARAAAKRAVTKAPGARYASVRFVTGALDRVADRASFIDLAGRAGVPILLVYADGAPPKSRAEMDALSAVAGVRTVRLARGKLAMHEEFAAQVAAELRPFLSAHVPPNS
jgi:pimeloyl-ACP methyl ester carboxylesterase